jgi:glutathione synthase/RimK-type ligase-like ATP-grasp enzyme
MTTGTFIVHPLRDTIFTMSPDAPKSVAFVTYAPLSDGTDDDRLAIHCLLNQGIKARFVVWNDPRVDWAKFNSIVLRSCWDYHERPAEFARWIKRLALLDAPLWNKPELVLWNMNKHYLSDLSAKGISTAPTVWLACGTAVSLPEIMQQQGWDRAVVKPVISASAHRTWLVSVKEAVEKQSELARMLQDTGVMVQRFVEEITERGEWSFVFLNREFSHAVLKQPAPGDFRVQNEFGGFIRADKPAPEMIEQAAKIMASVEGPCLYARVDAIDTGHDLMLMELELIEPYLFLAEGKGARRFADVIMSTLR